MFLGVSKEHPEKLKQGSIRVWLDPFQNQGRLPTKRYAIIRFLRNNPLANINPSLEIVFVLIFREYPELFVFDLVRLRSVYPAGMDPMGRGGCEKSRIPAVHKIRDTLGFSNWNHLAQHRAPFSHGNASFHVERPKPTKSTEY